MTKVVFTICSNNYLAQAKTLGDSILKYNPDYEFIICLCDKKNHEIDYSFFKPHQIIEASEIGIQKFDDMSKRYNIIELNTSIKPFVFDYIYKKFTNASLVMYFDPDTCLFDKLKPIEDEIKGNSILLTPHIYTPIEFDGKNPTENTFTQHGIYNLGFLATSRSKNTFQLLDWWKKRLEINCYDLVKDGIFVDQLPMNFAPIFFQGVKISDNWGLNMAPWNLHERELLLKDNKYFINDKYPLIFYHFSNCYPLKADLLAAHYDRITFEGRDVLRKMYDEYKANVIKNKYQHFVDINCVYTVKAAKKKSPQKTSTIYNIFKYIKKYPLFLFRKDFWA